jgi:hypothetical protein
VSSTDPERRSPTWDADRRVALVIDASVALGSALADADARPTSVCAAARPARRARTIEREGVDLRCLGPTTRRSMTRWRDGQQVSFWKVDELLTRLGRHVWELPDEVWLAHYCNGRGSEAA